MLLVNIRTILAVGGRSTVKLPIRIAFTPDLIDDDVTPSWIKDFVITFFPLSDLSLIVVFCLVSPIVFSLFIIPVLSRRSLGGFSFGTMVFSFRIWTRSLLVFGRSYLLLVTWPPFSFLFASTAGLGLFSKADSIWLLFSDVPFEFAFSTGGLGAFLSSRTVFCVSLGIRNRVINLHMHLVNLIGVYM